MNKDFGLIHTEGQKVGSRHRDAGLAREPGKKEMKKMFSMYRGVAI